MIWGYVERLDLAWLHAAVLARAGLPGHPPIDPRLMLALWLYATSQGIGSGRVLETLCGSDGFTAAADIEWAHAAAVALHCPPPKSKHGGDPFAPRPGDGPGVASWRLRMGSDGGKARYKRRSIHECVNARLRQWNLRQITVRGVHKARTVLHWFALAHNILRSHRLAAAAA